MLKFLVGALLCTATIAVNAQAVATVSQNNQSVSADKITVTFDNTPVQEALWTISRRSGARIIFAAKMLPDKKVSYKGVNVEASTAIEAVLQGTDATYERMANGAYKVVRTQQAKGQGVVSGKVTDAKTGNGLSGATVFLGNETRGVTSANDGYYRLSGVPAGSHTVVVRLVGYAKQTRVVTVGDGMMLTADFKLEPSTNVLDQVIVTGTVARTELRAVPNAITVVTAKQIEERGITRVEQLFRGDIPGLFALNSGSGASLDEVTMFSRGATALSNSSPGTSNSTNPIKTYVDGVELADPKYLSQIDPKSIERIEILSGPQASTIYGANAINGVMQIFTKRGTSGRPQLSLSMSSGVVQNNYNSRLAPEHVTDAIISGMERRLSYTVGTSWNHTGSWTPGKKIQRLSFNGGSKVDMGKFTADFSARRGLTKNQRNGSTDQPQTDINASGIHVYSASYAIPNSRTESLLGRTLGFSLSYRPFSWWSHEVGLGSDFIETQNMKTAPFYSSQSDTTLTIDVAVNSRKSERYSTVLQTSFSSLVSLNVTIGGDHWRSTGSSWSASPLSLTGNITPVSDLTRTKPEKNSGVYAQGQVGISDALFLTYGMRADWNPNFGDKAKVKPGRYGFSYVRDVVTPLGTVSTKLRGSYGRSIRPPAEGQALEGLRVTSAALITQFGSFYGQLPNPYLGPEHQQGGEGGLELYFGNRGSILVTRYNQTVDNLISSVIGVDSLRSLTPVFPNTANCSAFNGVVTFDTDGYCFRYKQQYLNVGSIRNQGWEMQSTANFGSLTTRGTYSWTKSRVLGITPKYRHLLTNSQFEPGRPFTLLPEHTWGLGVTYSRSASTVAFSLNGIGKVYSGFSNLSLAMSSGNRLFSSRPRVGMPSDYRVVGSGYTMADLNAMHRFSSRIDALFQVNNLTNYYRNDRSAQYASMGRESRAGVRLRW